jgi:hypothetical protein
VFALIRSLAAAAVAGLIGLGAVLTLYTLRPALAFDMDRPLPGFVRGIHGSERDGALTFAWTSDRVDINLDGLNRNGAWFCALRYRGSARGPDLPAPTVDVAIDDVRVARGESTPEYQELAFRIPAVSRSGARITMIIAPTFVPGGADTRTLGVQVDRFGCRPEGLTLPPRRALAAAGGAAAFAGAVLAMVGLSIGGVLLVAMAMGLGSAAMLAIEGGAYGAYPHLILRTSLWTSVVVAGLITVLDRVGRERLSSAARAVCVISGVALWLKLIALLHPVMPEGDATFNAHRLEWVLAGRYHFTQPFIGGVEMPYAIGLYLFTTLWTWFSADHTALVRGVTVVSDVAAGALLYPVVLRAWGQRRTAVLAVFAYQLPPLAYGVLGDGNLTNIFAQAWALVTIAAAVTWSLAPRRVALLLAFAGLLAFALLSHVSTATTLLATLGILSVLYFWRGDLARRRAAVAIVFAMLIAVAFAWFEFYRHFANEFAAAFARMFGGAGGAPSGMAKGYMSPTGRIGNLLSQVVSGAGWPLLILAVAGAADLLRSGLRDKLTSALAAWAIVWLVFSASTVVAKVDAEYVRYAAEFLGRINLATLPLIAILAARGANRKWLGIAMFAWAIVLAVQNWMAWFAS